MPAGYLEFHTKALSAKHSGDIYYIMPNCCDTASSGRCWIMLGLLSKLLAALMALRTPVEPDHGQHQGKQAAELRLQVHLEDVKARYAEITSRISAQNNILYFAVVLGGAVIALTSQLSERAKSLGQFLNVYLAIGTLFLILGLLHSLQEFAIAALARYVNREVRPKIERVVGEEALSWEDSWGKAKSSVFAQISSSLRTLVFMLPSAVATAYAYQIQGTRPLTEIEVALKYLNFLLLSLGIATTIAAASALRRAKQN